MTKKLIFLLWMPLLAFLLFPFQVRAIPMFGFGERLPELTRQDDQQEEKRDALSLKDFGNALAAHPDAQRFVITDGNIQSGNVTAGNHSENLASHRRFERCIGRTIRCGSQRDCESDHRTV